MNRTENQFRIATGILRDYKGDQPFALYLKQAFKDKRSGSSDRRFIRRLCYAALRVMKAVPGGDPEKSMIYGLLLTESDADPGITHILNTYGAGKWVDLLHLPTEQRIEKLRDEISIMKIFPLADRISRDLDRDAFIRGHLVQPLTWIRVQSDSRAKIIKALEKQGMDVYLNTDYPEAVGLEPSVNLDELLKGMKGKFEVQDLSSQAAVHDLEIQEGMKVWDCCAGSGGKTLSVAAQNKAVYFVTDNRPSIISNLKRRFKAAGIDDYAWSVSDLSAEKPEIVFQNHLNGKEIVAEDEMFDLVVADVPCSGSGTWGRNPEWLRLFKAKDLENYTAMQKGILRNVARFVRKGGQLVYITCSVYAPENEQMVEWIEAELGMKQVGSTYFSGNEHRSDTMFRSRFVRQEHNGL